MTSKEDVYGAFVDYYGDIEMDLIKNENGWAIYACKVSSGLNQNRYLFAVVQGSPFLPQKSTLERLDWLSFQTRTTDDVYKVITHNLYLNENRKKMLPDKITVIDRTNNETFYVTDDLPIKIRLLHDPKKNNYLQYPDSTTMYLALETYRCVVEML